MPGRELALAVIAAPPFHASEARLAPVRLPKDLDRVGVRPGRRARCAARAASVAAPGVVQLDEEPVKKLGLFAMLAIRAKISPIASTPSRSGRVPCLGASGGPAEPVPPVTAESRLPPARCAPVE